jgi:eukaryotic-like serine/threonine-protein kinase
MTAIMKAGRYEILGELGRGAMGVVYKATDPVIGRAVAVKTIKLSEEGTGLSRPELLARFQTEARAAGLLTHPNIVVVFDAGEEEGLYYITMELVEGKSVQALLDAGHAFPLPRVLRIMEQTCSALQFAHERNVVHRDIKPANIMLTGDDTVKVTDFGTAKILQFGTVQQTAHVMGTPSYMSPEQVKGRAVDGRSDIFSLGVMLYEMITGEKPFPGQSITTVIYKIVNEEPVPPRQINPTIHPGISAAVMRALAKEPEDRYQSCRELLEDLRNYRAVAGGEGNPRSTMVLGGQTSPGVTVAMNPGGLRGMHPASPQSTPAGRLAAMAGGNPMQTPVPRRTGAIPTYEAPKKRSIAGTIFAALLLLGVIAYGAYKLRPVFNDARQHHDSAPVSSGEPAVAPTEIVAPVTSEAKPAATDSAERSPSTSADTTPTAAVETAVAKSAAASAPVDAKVANPVVEKAPKKSEPVLNPSAVQFKQHVEEAIAARGLTGRAHVQGSGATMVLSGKLRPGEHGALLKLLRDAPADVRVVDHIEYDDTPPAVAETADEGSHPTPIAGLGAIHVVTDVLGATAVLHGPMGRALKQCQTPCSFNNLIPSKYSLDVKKDGYRPIETALQIKANSVSDQKLNLESLAKGLFLSSDPPGADVLIDGAKQSGQTPLTLPLAPGEYKLTLRLPGYEPYSSKVQVKDNVQTELALKLNAKSNARVAWAQVDTIPKGAEILVDGASTGKTSPSRVELPIGLHTVTLRLDGFKEVRRTVEVSDGGTVTVAAWLKRQ